MKVLLYIRISFALFICLKYYITHCSKGNKQKGGAIKDGFRPTLCSFTTLNPNYSVIRHPLITKLYLILDIIIFD